MRWSILHIVGTELCLFLFVMMLEVIILSAEGVIVVRGILIKLQVLQQPSQKAIRAQSPSTVIVGVLLTNTIRMSDKPLPARETRVNILEEQSQGSDE